jgi:hypothetical protein
MAGLGMPFDLRLAPVRFSIPQNAAGLSVDAGKTPTERLFFCNRLDVAIHADLQARFSLVLDCSRDEDAILPYDRR